MPRSGRGGYRQQGSGPEIQGHTPTHSLWRSLTLLPLRPLRLPRPAARAAQIGGMVLHEGRVAEMGTGEGKTLVAAAPAYLAALSGRGVHVVTVNDYLAKRDAEWWVAWKGGEGSGQWQGGALLFLPHSPRGLSLSLILPPPPPLRRLCAPSRQDRQDLYVPGAQRRRRRRDRRRAGAAGGLCRRRDLRDRL